MVYDFANETPAIRNAHTYGAVYERFAAFETECTFELYEERNFLRELFNGVLSESLSVEMTHCDDGMILVSCFDFADFCYDLTENVKRELVHVFSFCEKRDATEFVQALVSASINSDLNSL